MWWWWKRIASLIKEDISKEVKTLRQKTGKAPWLAVVLVGNNPASAVYVRNKNKTCKQLGFNSFENFLPTDTSGEQILNLINMYKN